MAEPPSAPVSIVRAGLLCRCPRCGRGKLFSGFLSIAPACGVCGLDLGDHDSGDGPAVPLIPAGSLGLLRPFKAILVALRFRHRARDGHGDERPGA